MPIRGPMVRYKQPDRMVEVLGKNPEIWRFVFKHLGTMNRILQRMKYAEGIFSGPKTTICKDHITIVGFDCLYKGRKPTQDAIGKIMRWRACKDITDV